MDLNHVTTRIQNYLSSSKNWPLIVDFANKEQLRYIVAYFNTGVNTFVHAKAFCNDDGTLKIDEFYNAIEYTAENIFVVEFSAFLKIQGEDFTKAVLRNITNKSVNAKVVILTYQCRSYLHFSDPRVAESGRVLIVDGEPDEMCGISFISPALAAAFPDCYNGFDCLAHVTENVTAESVYIATDIDKSSFPYSVFNIKQMNNGYDILCERDILTKTIQAECGSAEQWNYALGLMGNYGSWIGIADAMFGSVYNLAGTISSFNSFDDNKQWLYYIALSLFGVKDNAYLQLAIHSCLNYKELIKQLYRAILTVDKDKSDFADYYIQRKNVLRYFSESVSEATDFCKVVGQKEQNLIYYLTDLTQPEKEKVISWLDMYGLSYGREQLISILNTVYPDLAEYLSSFRFKNKLLDDYFDSYKYQKVVNKILPSFDSLVDEQSTEMQFASILKARTVVTEKIDTCNSQVYFVDAMGVEYLGYIQSKCNQYGLSADITCAYCELPSLTCYNKDFVDYFTAKGIRITDIKELDDIKHHGENSFDYEKVKIPIYLIRELEVIDEMLRKIQMNINNGYYDKAIVLSDHGSSRLAVIHESENLWSMATSGIHSGRCCPTNETDVQPAGTIEKEGNWVLTNYDRFRGGRKANVEVHGGATLEEVTVPIIEITRKPVGIEAFITEDTREILLGAKEFVTLKLYVGIKSNNISIRLNNKFYDAEKTTEEYIYSVPMSDISGKNTYSIDILNGNDVLAENQVFTVKTKAFKTNSLFD